MVGGMAAGRPPRPRSGAGSVTVEELRAAGLTAADVRRQHSAHRSGFLCCPITTVSWWRATFSSARSRLSLQPLDTGFAPPSPNTLSIPSTTCLSSPRHSLHPIDPFYFLLPSMLTPSPAESSRHVSGGYTSSSFTAVEWCPPPICSPARSRHFQYSLSFPHSPLSSLPSSLDTLPPLDTLLPSALSPAPAFAPTSPHPLTPPWTTGREARRRGRRRHAPPRRRRLAHPVVAPHPQPPIPRARAVVPPQL